jgi:SAM-dependent methyltransferase
MAKQKKYALTNSYFKNAYHGLPTTILEIAKYKEEHGELPFEYSGDNWVYDAFCERQKRAGVHLSQFLTPDATAERMMHFAGKYFHRGNSVCEPCCGTGQITKELLKDGYTVTAFDIDSEMVELCYMLYPEVHITRNHFKDEFGSFDQIVANPPYEIPVLTEFLQWILSVQSVGGISVLLLPAGFVDKDRPKATFETLRKFSLREREDMQEPFLRTGARAEIVVLEKL